ncbi:MAG TPA: hypothetical protein DCX07_09055 [Phycisphaerales bacterium]|nr:hypothetical protein [Phycisphaerales bacterium]
MTGVILICVGAGLMLFGAVMLTGWANGKSRWFNPDVYDREGSSKVDRQLLDLYFFAIIITPLLCGALLIVFGIRQLQ